MIKRIILLLLLLVSPFLAFKSFNYLHAKKTNFTAEESKEAKNTLIYMNMLVSAYSGCELYTPPEPKVVRVPVGHIGEHCPQFAIACYRSVYNTIYYEEGSIEEFGHEYGHAIFAHNKIPFTCMQELVLQQRDIYRYCYGDNYPLNETKRIK